MDDGAWNKYPQTPPLMDDRAWNKYPQIPPGPLSPKNVAPTGEGGDYFNELELRKLRTQALRYTTSPIYLPVSPQKHEEQVSRSPDDKIKEPSSSILPSAYIDNKGLPLSAGLAWENTWDAKHVYETDGHELLRNHSDDFMSGRGNNKGYTTLETGDVFSPFGADILTQGTYNAETGAYKSAFPQRPSSSVLGQDGGAEPDDSDDIRCHICAWSPAPRPNQTVKNRMQSVKQHVQRNHAGITYTCPVQGCAKTFTRRDNIKAHVGKVHPERYDHEYPAQGLSRRRPASTNIGTMGNEGLSLDADHQQTIDANKGPSGDDKKDKSQ